MLPVCDPVAVLHLRDHHLLPDQRLEHLLRAAQCTAGRLHPRAVRHVPEAHADHPPVLGRGSGQFGGGAAAAHSAEGYGREAAVAAE